RALPAKRAARHALPRQQRGRHVARERLVVRLGIEALRLASGDLDRAPVESHLVFELALLRLDADLVREDRERRIVLADLEDLEHLAVGVARADALPDGDLGELIAVEIAELEAGDHAGAAHAEIQKAELLATAVLGPADGEELPEHGHPLAAGAARDVAVRLARRDVRETVVAEEPFER